MGCVHFNLMADDFNGAGDLSSALDNTNRTEPSVFSDKSWSELLVGPGTLMPSTSTSSSTLQTFTFLS